ncbi:MAG: hypothetical protein N2C14_03695 [Planctomycetales bacterium]
MTEPRPIENPTQKEPAEPPVSWELRSQFTLRQIFAVTGGTAVLFACLAAMKTTPVDTLVAFAVGLGTAAAGVLFVSIGWLVTGGPHVYWNTYGNRYPIRRR